MAFQSFFSLCPPGHVPYTPQSRSDLHQGSRAEVVAQGSGASVAATVAWTHTLPADLGLGGYACLDSCLFSKSVHEASLSLA